MAKANMQLRQKHIDGDFHEIAISMFNIKWIILEKAVLSTLVEVIFQL